MLLLGGGRGTRQAEGEGVRSRLCSGTTAWTREGWYVGSSRVICASRSNTGESGQSSSRGDRLSMGLNEV